MENSADAKLPGTNVIPNFMSTGIPVINPNILQSVYFNQFPHILPNFLHQISQENLLDVAKIISCFSPQMPYFANQPDMVKPMSIYGNTGPISKPVLNPGLSLNSDISNGFPSQLPIQMQIPYLQPIPVKVFKSPGLDSEISETPISINVNDKQDSKLSKPKNRFLKRHYDDIKQETKELESDTTMPVSTVLEDDAPFGRSKCGKPLKSMI